MYKYNEKDAGKIATKVLKDGYNIRSRNGYTVLKSVIDLVLYNIGNGEHYEHSNIYNEIKSDLDFSAIYFNGYMANIASDAAKKN